MKMKPTLPGQKKDVSQLNHASLGLRISLTLNEGEQTLVLRVVGDEALDGTANLENPSACNSQRSDTEESYHGVLAHQDNTLATETQTNLVHLLRADIVDTDDEDSVVLIEKGLELIEVSGLGSGLAPHVSLFH